MTTTSEPTIIKLPRRDHPILNLVVYAHELSDHLCRQDDRLAAVERCLYALEQARAQTPAQPTTLGERWAEYLRVTFQTKEELASAIDAAVRGKEPPATGKEKA